MSSPLAVIRSRTRPLHAQLESSFDLTASLTSIETYRDLLERYLSIYKPFEAELANQPATTLALISWPERSRVAQLERDLAALGGKPEGMPAPALPKLDDLSSLLGALYVVEGSSLGGQIIYRQIQQQLGLDAGSGVAFFYGDGDATGSSWKRFTAILEANITDPNRAADAAEAMFHAFEQALNSQKIA